MQVRSLAPATRLNHRNILIIWTVMILIALAIILATAAFVQNDELSAEFDEDEFSIFQHWGTLFPAVSFLVTFFIPIRWMGVHVGVRCASDLGGGVLAPP